MLIENSYIPDTEEVLIHAKQVRLDELEYTRDNRRELLARAQGAILLRSVHDKIRNWELTHCHDDAWLFDTSTPTAMTDITYLTWSDVMKDDNHPASDRAHAGRVSRGAGIFNDFVSPMLNPTYNDEPAYDGRQYDDKETSCPLAEPYFISALETLARDMPHNQKRLTVYHDTNGKPLAFQKEHQVSTSLTLVPIALNEQIIPAGTIALVSEAYDTSGYYETRGGLHLTSYQVNDTLTLAPLRLSPWAFKNVLDIGMFALGPSTVSEAEVRHSRLEDITSHSIDSFKAAARQIMEMTDGTI